MLILRATTDLLRVITGLGGASIECHVSAIEVNSATPPVVQDLRRVNTAAITTATTTTILDCPTSGNRCRVMYASIRNDHASASETVEVVHSDGTNVETIIKATLLAGESLIYNGAGTWLHYDANGALYPAVGNAATQSDMEGGTATDKYVTPNAMKWHPGVAKFWGKFGVTGNTIAGWNVDSPTDNGTGDITVNITTDFSSANWCAAVAVEMTATTYGVANTRECHVRSGGQAAGTLRCDCVDNTATTSLIKDPTAWHVAGWGDQ